MQLKKNHFVFHHSADPKNWANSCCWRSVLLFKHSKLGKEMNSRGPNGSWSFSLVGHWAEPQWVLGAMVGCQLFIMPSAKGTYWFQINFYCMQFSQHEMLHCHSSVTDNPLQSPTGETAATTWMVPFKITLGEVSWLWTEAGGAQRAFPSHGWGHSPARRVAVQLHILLLTGAELGRGRAQPCPLLAAPGGRWACAGSTTGLFSAESTLWKGKKTKTEEAKMNNSIIIWCAEISAEISSKIHIVYSSWWVSQVLKLCSRLKC